MGLSLNQLLNVQYNSTKTPPLSSKTLSMHFILTVSDGNKESSYMTLPRVLLKWSLLIASQKYLYSMR